MKAVALFIIALAASFAARADTFVLGSWPGWGALHQYHEVPSGAGGVTIYLPQYTLTGGMQLWFDDQVAYPSGNFRSYWIGTYNGTGVQSTLQKCVFPMDPSGQVNTGPCALNGETLDVTLDETVRIVKSGGSGRGGGYGSHRVWTLTDGIIER